MSFDSHDSSARQHSPPIDHQHDWTMEMEVDALRHFAELSPADTPHPALENVPQAEPLPMASVWQMESLSAADNALTAGIASNAYRRVDHPNARSLATKMAHLHGAQRALVTAQGMSSMTAVALAILRPKSKVWLSQELYGETSQLFSSSLRPWQVETETFDPTNDEHLRELTQRKADMVVIETMTNPRLHVADIALVARATHAAGGLLVVDNTFATHLLCQPLRSGADFVIESLGKQVNGHSDGMVGFVGGKDAQQMASVAAIVKTMGLTSSPLDCYLTHRGLLTLAVRMQRACANALALARFLSGLPIVRSVDYPGLLEHANYTVAQKQFTAGFGWMVTFHVDLKRAGVERLLAELSPEIRFVPSLGDVNTTISHPLLTSHRASSAQSMANLGITMGTIRVSCGLEPSEWIINCFRRALAASGAMIESAPDLS